MKKLIIFEIFLIIFFVLAWNVSKAIEDLEIKCESVNGNFHYKTDGEWLYEKNKGIQKYKLLTSIATKNTELRSWCDNSTIN